MRSDMRIFRLFWDFYKAVSVYVPILAVGLAVALSGVVTTDVLDGLLWLGAGGISLTFIIMLRRVFRNPPPASHGSASFADKSDLRRHRLLGRRGLIVGKRTWGFIRFNRDGHLLTFAPTRSGKGVGCVIPNLLDHRGSVVVTDIKGENYTITGRWRRSFSRVYRVAPFDGHVPGSRYNPLDFIRTGCPEDVDDAALIADLLVSRTGHDTFWDSEAQNLLAGLLLYAATDLSAEQRSLHGVWALLMQDQSGFDDVIARMRASEHPAIRRAGEGFSQKEERERSAVISTAQTHMKIWKSSRLAAATQSSDFQMEDLKRTTMSLYIVIPPELLNVYHPFLRLMVGLSVSAMTRVPGAPKERVLFLLDEIAALGRMAPIESGIGYLAGYGVSLWLFFQDLDQIQKTYPKWRSIIANCNVRQAFGVSDYQTAKELSDMLGNRTVSVSSSGRSKDWLSPIPDHVHRQHSETGRPLMAPDEIMVMPEREQLIFVQACRPILARKVRYFKERLFQGRYEVWRPDL